MQTWKALQKEFPGINGSIDFQALQCALNNADQDWLTNIAVQLHHEEPKHGEVSKKLIKNRDGCVDGIGKLRQEISRLEQESTSIDQRIVCAQDAVDKLQSERSNLAKTIQKIQCDVAKKIECDKRKAHELKRKISRNRRKVRDKILSRCAQVMVLRAGQMIHAEHLEDLIEKKPCILANWKYDLKCKRKKLMQLQTKQQQHDLDNEYAQREQLEERSCQIRQRQQDIQVFNEELDHIRQQKSDMDCLIRRYTDELVKTGETPADVAAVRRFFLSLHGCDKECPTVSVMLTPENEGLWKKALEIHELQKQLIDRYEENFLLEHNVRDLELDEGVLAVAVDADFPPVSACEIPKPLQTGFVRPSANRKCRTLRTMPRLSSNRPKSADACNRGSVIDQWAGFVVPPEVEKDCNGLEVSFGRKSRPITPAYGDCPLTEIKKRCEKSLPTCKPLVKKPETCRKEPAVQVASFLQSDSQLFRAFNEDCNAETRKQIVQKLSRRQRSCSQPKTSTNRYNKYEVAQISRCSNNSLSELCSSGCETSDQCPKKAVRTCQIEKKTTQTVKKSYKSPLASTDKCSVPIRESPLQCYDEERVIREDQKRCEQKSCNPPKSSLMTCCNRQNLPSCTKAPCLHAPVDDRENPSQKCFKKDSRKCEPLFSSRRNFCSHTAQTPEWGKPLYLVVSEYESSRCPASSAKCERKCKDWNKIAKRMLTSPQQRMYAHQAARHPLAQCEHPSAIRQVKPDRCDSISCATQPRSTVDALSFLCSISSDLLTEEVKLL
ncbi:uncharacterized protein LOC129601225 isoform X2 [Paramacrobiotus metropolitanus]|uniref:uncharacterized protein LOC129601225 isoform X2 n=1 Tax=Paramacrobiotus metropolitanus TaxID=2943436 RepID=UPI002445BFA3|nr:uncharacterized protein LOC129601225 isoform X2 [Paramacrobiotus metropolitanus]